eukprot:499219-Pelagomonas_calceolata.AAC.3
MCVYVYLCARVRPGRQEHDARRYEDAAKYKTDMHDAGHEARAYDTRGHDKRSLADEIMKSNKKRHAWCRS